MIAGTGLREEGQGVSGAHIKGSSTEMVCFMEEEKRWKVIKISLEVEKSE